MQLIFKGQFNPLLYGVSDAPRQCGIMPTAAITRGVRSQQAPCSFRGSHSTGIDQHVRRFYRTVSPTLLWLTNDDFPKLCSCRTIGGSARDHSLTTVDNCSLEFMQANIRRQSVLRGASPARLLGRRTGRFVKCWHMVRRQSGKQWGGRKACDGKHKAEFSGSLPLEPAIVKLERSVEPREYKPKKPLSGVDDPCVKRAR